MKGFIKNKLNVSKCKNSRILCYRRIVKHEEQMLDNKRKFQFVWNY